MGYILQSINTLKKNRYRITGSRESVAAILAKNKKPLNAYEIAEQINRSKQKIDTVTVYRVLELFHKLKLVHKINEGFVSCHHPACADETHCHHQFICEKCKEVSEIHNEKCIDLKELNKKFPELKINSHKLELIGTCASCG